MGIPVLIMGETGAGKSYSLRNFTANDVSIFNVAGKELPFRGKLPLKETEDYKVIKDAMKASKKKTFVIDDSQYLMGFASLNRAKEQGYNKYAEMALDMYKLIRFIKQELPKDVIVYLLHHTETDSNTGKVKAKTVGKMLDNHLTLEGLFTIVLLAVADEKRHIFITQSDGMTTAKSPVDMFQLEIPNDLKAVDTSIRNYYELN